jgi:hypothetical protein
MKIGQPGDSLSLVRVLAAMVVCGAALAGLGYLFDLIVGPAISMSGWWTVFGSGGVILGGMIQATREFAVPQVPERRALAAEARARAASEAPSETPARAASEARTDHAAQTTDGPGDSEPASPAT